MKIRKPAVAGTFYPHVEGELVGVVDAYLSLARREREPAKMVVSPHAGYVYSGKVAGATMGEVLVPRKVIVLGPKHRRDGADAAVARADAWKFPFGNVPIDAELSELVAKRASLELDDEAHEYEHSLEVQVPFLWRSNPDVTITAVALGYGSARRLHEIGAALASAIEEIGEPVLIVASTDMSHHIPEEDAKRLDQLAIDRILDLDPAGLWETVTRREISMCGVVPTTVGLYAANALGAEDSRLVRYATSGDVNGDRGAVVGYAGVVID